VRKRVPDWPAYFLMALVPITPLVIGAFLDAN
jgi:hypothetical protein